MLSGRYLFSATLLDDALLPPYKGSTFRGAFGICLKKAVCAVRQKECADCLLASRCIYAQLFELKRWEQQDARTAAPPHPYVIEPTAETRTHYQAGEPFDFTLLLFGEMNRSLPYFVYAFQLMGEQGIGKKQGEHRARCTLQGVRCNGIELYDPATGRLASVPEPVQMSLAAAEQADDIPLVSLKLLTPLRLKSDNRLQASLPFPLLVRALLRRVSGLLNAFGAGEPPLDYRGMIARAEQVQVVDGRLYWHEWERYSNRQEQAMNFGGMLGSVTYQGKLAEYLPLLRLCETLHIGKQTTFGLGRYQIEELGNLA